MLGNWVVRKRVLEQTSVIVFGRGSNCVDLRVTSEQRLSFTSLVGIHSRRFDSVMTAARERTPSPKKDLSLPHELRHLSSVYRVHLLVILDVSWQVRMRVDKIIPQNKNFKKKFFVTHLFVRIMWCVNHWYPRTFRCRFKQTPG